MGDCQRRISARQQSAPCCKYLLSGFIDHEKAELAMKIINLGSKYLEVPEYTSECSHVVCVKPMRSEKYLCACAAGKWVLTKDYIIDSSKAGKWLKEEQYQWGIRNINDALGQSSMAKAPARWHRTVQETGKKAFDGWKVAIFVENKKRKPTVYKRVIECGGGKVLSARLPIKDPDALATQLTHVLVDKTYENDVDTLLARGIPCVLPDFIAEHLFEEHPNLTKYSITKTTSQNRCQSIVTSGINSACSSQRSSLANSKTTSPVKVMQERATRALRITRTKALSAPATASISTPVKSTQPCTNPVINVPNTEINILDVAETVRKRQEKDPLSFVPHWMQVTPPKPKSGDQCALPFPKVICNVIEGCVEEGLWRQAVATVTSNLSVSKFPPSEIIHIIMMEMIKSDSSTVASSGFHMLKTILCLHSPMTSPSLAQIYLQSMLPPCRQIEGFHIEEEQPIRCHWDFMDRVIRNSLQKVLPVDTLSKEEKEKEFKSQMNHQLLLKYLVALLEQDFKGYQARCSDPKKMKTFSTSCMMSSILWPTGQRKVTTSVRCLLEHFTNAVKQTQENENMCTLLRMLATLVSMSAELLYLSTPTAVKHSICTQDGTLLELAYELVSVTSQGGLVDSSECLHIMLTVLQPSWLKMCVTEILLQDYDHCLVLPQFKMKAKESLSLEKLVNYYFYLLPHGTDTNRNTPEKENIASPLKKTTQNPRMVNALQTLADSNHTKATGKKRKLDKVSEPKVSSPMKKRRVMQVNKRNAKGETQLHVACIKNDIVKLRQLLATPGIQVNMTDYAGWTPLHEAANHGHIGCIKELLKFKPQPNIMAFLDKESKKAYGGIDLLAAPAECGTTPLHDAVQNGHTDIVKLLVQSGGKSVLMAKNAAGLIPQDIARTKEMELALLYDKQLKTHQHQKLPEKLTAENVEGSMSDMKQSPTNSKPGTLSMSNSCPSEELYVSVLGLPQKPKRFVTAVKTEQYCMLVRHLLRAYVQIRNLADIKAEVDRRLANEGSHLQSSHDKSSGDNSLFFSPVGVATLPLVKLKDIGLKTGRPELKNADKMLAEDLAVLAKMENHVTGFIHHVARFGPWVGSTKSSTCKAIFLELKLLATSWQG